MFEVLHSTWQQLASWYNADRVMALLCLCIGLVAVLLWIWLKKWEWLYHHTPVAPAMALGRNLNSAGASYSGIVNLEEEGKPSWKGGQALEKGNVKGDLLKCLVVEWEVHEIPEGIVDIGDLEQRLLKLQDLRLDYPYQVIVSLYSENGVLSPRASEILARRFPGYMFLEEENSLLC